MDGSQHPERTESTVRATDVPDPFANEQQKEVTSPNGDPNAPTAKRQHDADDDDPATKRAHVEVEEPEDLDLDALLAQLQQHTDRAKMDNAGIEPVGRGGSESPGEHSERETHATETELSIEQQLKGALSSLQDMEGDDDDDDDDESTTLAIDQLSNILKPSGTGEQTSGEKDRTDDSTTDPSSAQPTGLESPRAKTQPPGDGMSSGSQFTSVGLETQSRPGIEDSQQEETSAEPKADGLSPATDLDPHKKRESLLAKMPPLPAQGSGPLPPMPPPPAAFTSPTAPLTALELSRNAHLGSLTSTDPEKASIDARLQRIHQPTFSEIPPHSQSYEAAIVDQVDQSVSGEGQESVTGLLLNDSQSVLQARQKSILLLDALASQVLDFLSFSHYQETLATVMQPDSERGMAYRMLLDAFEDVKRMYLKWRTQSSSLKPHPKHEEVRPFLPYDLPGVEPTRDNMTTIQRANMATFVAAIFGTIEIGFWELDKWFLKVFVPVNGRLFKQQANIYLDLKTQAYISAVEGTDNKDVHEDAIEHLFPKDLEATIQDILGERMSLAPSEQDFVEKCHRRKDNILAEDKHNLSTKYHWVPFLREICDYISRNHYTLLPRRKLDLSTSDQTPTPYSASSTTPRGYSSMRTGGVGSSRLAADTAASSRRRQSANSATTGPSSHNDTADVQVSAVRQKDTSNPKLELDDQTSSVEPSDGPPTKEVTPNDGQISTSPDRREKPDDPKRPDIPAEGHPLFPPLPKQVLPPPSGFSPQSPSHKETTQSNMERSRRPGPRAHSEAPVAANSPTDTLAVYEAAKASAEGTDAIRPKTSMFTTRRVWTKEEEEALLKGMDRVQGPYWAQILELYGPGGKISEVLKDRSQVQLKDKARNLKMFFVRLGLPIPAVFQYVTGDYETRRSSGKKIREKKQQHAGPSGLSHEVLRNDTSQRAPTAAQSPAIISAGSLQSPEGAPSAGSSTGQPKKTEQTASSSQLTVATKERDTAEVTSSDHQTETGRLFVKESTIRGSADEESHETVDNTIVRPEPNREDLTQEFTPSAALSKEEPRNNNISDLEKAKPHESFDAGERGTAPTDYGNAEDKDDDLSSLLNRVGEYVENH